MVATHKSPINKWLQQTNSIWFVVYATVAAFGLYTCVYAFRKAFSVATFEGISYGGISYKVWLITFQVIGYALSKFVGIKVISELKANTRFTGILLMVSIAGISWLFFASIPPPYNIVFLFSNGFPLGLVWGMIFGYLEGRRFTEALGAGLSISFIFSAGFAKTVGSFIMQAWGVSDVWMPFVTSCIFFPPLLMFLWLLNQLHSPSVLDELLRTKRQPMDAFQRRKFLVTFLPGIIFFTLGYILLTMFRELRDNFSAELWASLGYKNSSEIFTVAEIPVSLTVMLVMGSLMIIRNNHLAFMANHIIILSGLVLIGISTALFEAKFIGGPLWMVLLGTGLYLGYVPFNSIFFDRLLASFKYVGTVGFMIYVVDAFGYLGSIGVLILRTTVFSQTEWITFFTLAGYVISFFGTVLICSSMAYFYMKKKKKPTFESIPNAEQQQAFNVI